MSNIVSLEAFKSDKSRIDPLVADILDALRALGGAAHRQTVADWVNWRRTGSLAPSSPLKRREIYEAYAAYLEMAVRRRPAPLLYSPLGSESYRWALTDAAVKLLENGEPTFSARATR
jgi:hypothetical protein